LRDHKTDLVFVNPTTLSSHHDQHGNDALSLYREGEEDVSRARSDRKRMAPTSVPVHENHQQAPIGRRGGTSIPSLIIQESISEEDIEKSSDTDESSSEGGFASESESESESGSVLGDENVDDISEEEEEDSFAPTARQTGVRSHLPQRRA
jgi:hypothetical protein